jgi:hypothetical protein
MTQHSSILRLKLHAHLLMESPSLPSSMPSPLTYVFAGNGVFLWGKRDGLEALIPVSECVIQDLYPVSPFVRLDGPKIDRILVEAMLKMTRSATNEAEQLVEALFYLAYSKQQGWQASMPAQIQTPASVRPVLELLDQDAYSRTLMEVHSHPRMSAFYSGTDNRGENGFRLYGVVGLPDSPDGGELGQPEIRMRVSIFGAYWEFPPEWVLDLPAGLVAAASLSSEERQGEKEGGMHEEESAY